MAIVSEFLSKKLVTRLNYGMSNGKEVIKSKSYANVRNDATLAAVMSVATAITSLQVPTLEDVHCVEEDLILNDGL